MANNVIFIHPDGTSPSHYAAARFVHYGPDGRLNWDKMSEAGVYLGHMENQLTGTSNAGAVTHAMGVKVHAGSYGLDEEGNPIVPLSGMTGLTIMEEAIAAGKATAIINSGIIAEPGTGAFLAEAPNRNDFTGITAQIVESGATVIMGGGEIHYLPVGTVGRFGEEGVRTDGRNLVEEAIEDGYTVVYTLEELQNLPLGTEKVLGIFAAEDTYNDTTEENLAAQGLGLYGQPGNENPPTVAQMLEATLKIVSQDEDGFLVVLEEEGSDNFANNNNAAGTIEATKRADDAIGVAMNFIDTVAPNTLLITAADSDAGGLEIVDRGNPVGSVSANPTTSGGTNNILDGVDGPNTEPFIAAPDANGDSFSFGVGWVGTPDFPGSIVSKTYGLNADLLPSTIDNTGIYRLMYQTLFEVELPSPIPAPDPEPAPPATQNTGNVIFIHPDGTSPSHYAAARFLHYGPDGRLNWDQMSDAGVYLGHMENQLTGTSNAGAVTHAMGVKVHAGSYGLDEEGNPVVPLSGNTGLTIMEEAIAAGKATAVINSGIISEPGTGAFLAEAANRNDFTGITAQIVESGVNVILGGGEIHYLPVGTVGRFGQQGVRTDGRNLVQEAQEDGYTVVYTLEELQNLPLGTERVLGIFAAEDTYNDTNEETLAEQGLGLYGQPGNENPPTVAQMLTAAISIVSVDPDGFFIVLEEEGSDNFANNNNAAGTIEATKRADDAIGVAMDYIRNENPNTLLLTAADSDAGGLEIRDPLSGPTVGTINPNPTTSLGVTIPLDGQNGANTAPFVSAPDANGDTFNFGVGWVGTPDFAGSIVSKAFGLNADQLPSTLDNTEIYRLMYKTLFGVEPGQPTTFTLQLLHASDFEAAIPALEDAPRFSAVLNALRNQDNDNNGQADYQNTLFLSSGDNYIPGVWSFASNEVYGSQGRADIAILNELGLQASAFGNHEFDFGTGVVANVLAPDAEDNYAGAQFPYLSANLDFSPDPNLDDFVTEDGQEASEIEGKIAKSTIITVNGQKIGVVGATTPILQSLSAPGGTIVTPEGFPQNPTDADIQALADIIQASVDELLADNPDMNKVILLSHMQQLSIEQALAPKLQNVDIIVAGGSHSRLLDENDRLRAGDTNQGEYPIFTTDADGNPIAIVNTDANYKYVGRLVIDFDSNGLIIPESYDAEISGAYATDEAGVAAVGGTPDPEVVAITEALQAQIAELESNFFGITTEYLNGNRAGTGLDGVRNQETNLGNLTADANLAVAKEYDPEVVISLKNGGGIRNSIGRIDVVGTNEPERLPPAGNDLTGKPEGGISQLDIANSLSFNNELSLVTVTAQELLNILEHGIAASTNDPASSQGRFPQVGGLAFSFDLDLPAGDRIQSLAIKDSQGNTIDTVVRNGELIGNPNRTFRMVTLSFLVDGGDGYSIPDRDRIDLAQSEEAPRTGEATFTADGTEQDALAEYLSDNFLDTPFNQEDTPRELDQRIQNLDFRSDTVLADVPELPKVVNGTSGDDYFDSVFPDDKNFVGDDQVLFTGSGNDYVDLTFALGANRIDTGSGDDLIFAGTNNRIIAGSGDDLIFVGTGAGNNIITGGAGADQFWVVTDEEDLPVQANTITDFKASQGDVIGFANTSLTFGALTLTQSGRNTLIQGFEQDIVTLLNTQASSLVEANFVFA